MSIMDSYNPNPNSKPSPHAICLPFPLQSHIRAMIKLAKLLHNEGFHITFVNTEYHHKRLPETASLGGDRFCFETIPDGLPPPSDPDAGHDVTSLAVSLRKNISGPFFELVSKINDNQNGVVSPPVSCVVADGFMPFAVQLAVQEFGVPLVKFFPISACGLLGMQQSRPLVEQGLLPLPDENSLIDGYLDKVVENVPGMKDIRLRDLPSFCRTTNLEDILFQYCMDSAESAHEASSVVIQTFDALEPEVLDALSDKIPNLYAIGPLQLLLNSVPEDPLKPIQYNLWKEETECLKWLDNQNSDSVIYVNFGSTTLLTAQQVVEFGWGLANSNHPFLWVIRPDLVIGKSACLSDEFMAETRERGLIISWCPQEDVLNHPSVGGFLTHCGWNSILESVSAGVPMLCYPFYGEQQTNCWLICNRLGIAMEIGNDVKRGQEGVAVEIDNNIVKRDEVEEVVRELMEGEKGKKIKSKAMEMKKAAQEATSPSGTSSINLDNLVKNKVLLKKIDA